jgi:hypothetical protein
MTGAASARWREPTRSTPALSVGVRQGRSLLGQVDEPVGLPDPQVRGPEWSNHARWEVRARRR